MKFPPYTIYVYELQLILNGLSIPPGGGGGSTVLGAVIGLVGAFIGVLGTFAFGRARDNQRVRDERKARHEDHVLEAVSDLVAVGRLAARSAASMRESQRSSEYLREQIAELNRADYRDHQQIESLQGMARSADETRRASLQDLFGHMKELSPHQYKLRILSPSLVKRVETFTETVGNATHSAPESDEPGAITANMVDAAIDALIGEAQEYLEVPAPDDDLVLNDPTHAAPLGHGNSPAAWTMVLLIVAGVVNVMIGMLTESKVVIIAGIIVCAAGVLAGIIMGKAGMGAKRHIIRH